MDHIHYLVIDGKPSRDFNVYVSGAGTYSAPERSYEEVEVPGRNGTIFLYDENYKNIDVSYDAWIGKIDGQDEVDKNFRNLRSFLLSREGYFRLEDTYHPDEFRFATYIGEIDADVEQGLQAVSFEMTFSCKPQRFLKKHYDIPIEITTSGTNFHNETYFKAKPLIRVYGTGTINIGGVTVRINSASSYTDIDCELQEAYKDTLATNCNGNITLTNAQFPYLVPGDNQITFSGPSRIVMYPRLFML